LAVPRLRGESILGGFPRGAKAKDAAARVGAPELRSPGDLTYFHDMLERTPQIFSRYEIYRTDSSPPNGRTKQEIQLPFEQETLNVVTIGSDLNIWNEADMEMDFTRDGCRLLKPKASMNVDRWMDERILELEEAMKLDPNVIIFPEFAYPPPQPTVPTSWAWEDIDAKLEQREEFDRRALQVIGNKNVFLILGSFHCLMSLYNVGVIFPWGSHRDGQADFTRVQRDHGRLGLSYFNSVPGHDRINAPILYRKRFPARKVGEQTRVPTGREFNIFKCSFGKVVVLICSDVLDINQFLTIVRESLAARDFDFVLIPAYNPATSFNDICRDLSNLAATTVVVANAHDRGVNLPSSELFVCGQDSDQLPKSEDPTEKKIVTVRHAKAGFAPITLFELDMAALKQARETHLKRLGVSDGPELGNK
jgi:predicted amidohydrolase